MTVAPGGVEVVREAGLTVPAGGRATLVGPSGAGKTTLLRCVAGLEPAVSGTIAVGGRDVTALPSHRRRVAYVFQEPRLFPAMDVADNVAFPLRVAGMARAERGRRATELLSEVGLSGFATRSIRGLSGGEAQRVALARALSAAPDALLLDEPLAGVDPNRREALRALILRLQEERRLTMLLVTHDRAEAAEMGQHVALMLEGRVVQEDSPEALFQRPASPAVARFLGSRNMLRGEVRGGELVTPAGALPVPGSDGDAAFTIRPECVEMAPDGPLSFVVEETSFLGTAVRVRMSAGGLRLEALVLPAAAPPAGGTVRVRLPSEALWRFPEGAPLPSPAQ